MPFPSALTHITSGYGNGVALRLAGHVALADVEHVGRTSGTVRHTPVRAFRGNGTVVIGLNFGRESDWFKNVQAAGGCRMRLGDEVLELGAPRLVPIGHRVESMPWLFWIAVRYLAHTAVCVQLPVLSGTPIAATTTSSLFEEQTSPTPSFASAI